MLCCQCSGRRLGVIYNQISWFYICAEHMNFIVMKASTKRGLSRQGLCSRVRIPRKSPSEGLRLNFWIMFKPFRLWEVRNGLSVFCIIQWPWERRLLSSEYKMLQTFQWGMLSLWERVDTMPEQGSGLQRWMLQGVSYPTPRFNSLSPFVCPTPSTPTPSHLLASFLPCHHMNSFCHMFPMPQCSVSQQAGLETWN